MKIKSNKKVIILAYVCLLALVRILCSMRIPILALADNTFDDAMGVDLAKNLLGGRWLGEYTYLTLQKGASFPIFLAGIKTLDISYNVAVLGLWILSVVIFCHVMRAVLSDKTRLILYILLLYNPIMFENNIVQRVYRSSISPAIMLLIVSFYLWMYFDLLYKNKIRISRALLAGIFLAFFMNLRDDGIYIYPMILTISLVMIGVSFFKRTKRVKVIMMVVIPFAILIGCNHLISAINYHYYGVYYTTEPSHSNFREFRDLLYAIKNETDIPCVSVSREKLKRLYKISPTLSEVSPYLEAAMDGWADTDRNPGDGEVEDGWIRWALRDGMNRAGAYSDAKTANELYKKISDELRAAINDGQLETQKLLPIDVLPVWKPEYLPELISVTKSAFIKVINYENIACETGRSSGKEEDIRYFETITNAKALYPTAYEVKLNGWFATNQPQVSLVLKNKETGQLASLEWQDSKDVENVMNQSGNTFLNVDKCRFTAELVLSKKMETEGWELLCIDDAGNLIEDIALENENKSYNINGNILQIDELVVEKKDDSYLETAQKWVNFNNLIIRIVVFFEKIIDVIGFLAFLCLGVIALKNLNKDGGKLLNSWLVSLAFLLTFTVLAVAESLLQITAFDALLEIYLAPGYVLMMLFFLVPLLALIDYSFERKQRR